jgi:hypothetical protein
LQLETKPKKTLRFSSILLSTFSLLSFSLLFVIYFISLYKYQSLVLDNHTVELGVEDRELILRVARQGLKKLSECSP